MAGREKAQDDPKGVQALPYAVPPKASGPQPGERVLQDTLHRQSKRPSLHKDWQALAAFQLHFAN